MADDMASEVHQPWEPTKDHVLLHIYDGDFIRPMYLKFNLPIPKPPHHVTEIGPISPWHGHAELAGDPEEDEQPEQQQQDHHRRRAFRFSTLAGLFIVFLCIILPLFPSLEPLAYLGLAAFWLAS